MDNFSILAVFDAPSKGLRGNTAAVLYGDTLPAAAEMQYIAGELNQPATTFLAPHADPNTFEVRWYAPDSEIQLCGHGTLAAIAFLRGEQTVHLKAKSHHLSGYLSGAMQATMSIAPILSKEAKIPDGLEAALKVPVISYRKTSNKDIVVTRSEKDVVNMVPDFAALRKIPVFGYAVTAPGDDVDFVSRTLVPHVAQLEDHATGSSHAALAPFWASELGKSSLKAIQRSPRGGYFEIGMSDTVELTGHYTEVIGGSTHHV